MTMQFIDQDLHIFHKGNYEPINSSFITEAVNAMQPINAIQKKYEKNDTDTFINEVRDSLVGRLLGFDLINKNKHGFDGKKIGTEEFLEVKQTSFSSNSWGGTFNDTNLEKADAFKDKKLFLTVAVWDGMTDLIAMVYGQNPAIGDYLEQRVRAVANTSTRSTQSITVSNLITKYGFIIVCPPNKSKAEVRSIFIAKSSAFRTVPGNLFIDYDEFIAQ